MKNWKILPSESRATGYLHNFTRSFYYQHETYKNCQLFLKSIEGAVSLFLSISLKLTAGISESPDEIWHRRCIYSL